MRYRAWLPLLLGLAACGSAPKDASKVTLKNSVWDLVHIQVVVTRSANCDDRGPEFVEQNEYPIPKDKSQEVVALSGTTVCVRHDRNPSKPVAGEWSGWTRIIPFPGEDVETEI
jgi:hypothetical protein